MIEDYPRSFIAQLISNLVDLFQKALPDYYINLYSTNALCFLFLF